MKKAIAILLSLCFLFVCCACNGDGGNTDTPAKTPTGKTDPADNTDPIDNTDVVLPTKSPGTIEMNGVPYESFIVPDVDMWNNSDTVQDVEYNTVGSTLDTPWEKYTIAHPAGHSDDEATALRNSVLNSPNGNYKITGTTYYISPKGDDNNSGKSPSAAIKTTSAILKLGLKRGDALLFERGGVWHLTRAIKCTEGVTYGAYGTGEKPAIFGSPANYADPKYWTPSNLKNVWKLDISDSDIGIVVFDHGEIVGEKTKNGLLALSKNGDYYFNASHSLLYVYYDGGNPGRAFKDIECGLNKAIFDVNRISDVTIDNFKIKYSARLGIDLAAADNSVVTNCEVGFIGGAYQNSDTRLGNGIQMWQGCDGHRVENCWVYQIYDTGISPQGDSLAPLTRAKQGTHDEDYLNITYRNNLVEYCCLSFEIWQGNHNSGGDGKSWVYTDGKFENIHIDHNISRFAGYGWSSMAGQRPDPHGEHIVLYNHTYPYAREFYIEDNIFDLCSQWICRWQFSLDYKEDTKDYTRKKIGGEVIQYTENGATLYGVSGGTPDPIDFNYPNG
ncbi:MAG: hypothetical protein IK086_02275, partial [Clostridia bacterium]|nr:hypothetical protein [Clostridia bacterium]